MTGISPRPAETRDFNQHSRGSHAAGGAARCSARLLTLPCARVRGYIL